MRMASYVMLAQRHGNRMHSSVVLQKGDAVRKNTPVPPLENASANAGFVMGTTTVAMELMS